VPDFRQLYSLRFLASIAMTGLLAVAISYQVNGIATPDADGKIALETTHEAMAKNLRRSAVVWTDADQLPMANLQGTNGIPLPGQILGKWSLLFFGFSSCTHVCPMTLSTLSRAADTPGSGIGDGDTQVLFVTVDPETDSLDRLVHYLAGFDERFNGYTGSAAELEGFADAVGAAFAVNEQGIDHSTSVFLIDPDGHPAGVLLRPTRVERLLADIQFLKQEAGADATAMSAGND